jgi:hypothetical protein
MFLSIAGRFAAKPVQIVEQRPWALRQRSAGELFICKESLPKIISSVLSGCGTENAQVRVLLHLFSPFPA